MKRNHTYIDEDKFLESMDYLKPTFDTALLAYLQYAIQEEIVRVSLAGGDVNKVPSVWLQGIFIYKSFSLNSYFLYL